MKTLLFKSTNQKEVIDITDYLESVIENHTGLVNLFLKHTSAAITIAELDPGTEEDYVKAYEMLTPEFEYKHVHNPPHFPDHFLSSTIGSSLSVPVSDGKFELGTWQRIVLLEFNGPKEKEIVVTLIKDSS